MTDPQIYRTNYDRDDCEVGVIHIGYGAFHRAHQAVYLDDYMQETGDLRWGIAAVNLRPSETPLFERAQQSTNGYVLKSIAPDGTQEFRLVRAHLEFVDATENLEDALNLFARSSTKCVSMTVTESGYSFRNDWSLDLNDEAITRDIHFASAGTIYGFLTLALERRAQQLNMPITVLCCDNIRGNGAVLKNALLSFVAATGKTELADWIRNNTTFPCSMVDRITPRSTPELEFEVEPLFSESATNPIHAEKFSQWVLQNQFASDMPDLSRVGVQVVPDVEPYEEVKIRILNGGHTGLTYLGALAGHRTFDQAMHDPSLRAHFDQFETEEVLPGLGREVPIDTAAYLSKVSARFENAGIADQLERICTDGYSKMAIYIRPTLRSCLDQGIRPLRSFDCIAAWVVFARKFKAGKASVSYHEPFWERLEPLLTPGNEVDLASDTGLWGDLPQMYESFVPDLIAAIEGMEQKWQA